uniref:BAR/IMD domain containing adaptor protein 2 like 2b n=1 Tax=Gasterosteus aculeatus TaxID=69293 RepID=G3Q8K9_GASAC
MSGSTSDQLHRSTLTVYLNLMETFNPGLQNLVALGNSYVMAFQGLAEQVVMFLKKGLFFTSTEICELSCCLSGDVLVQISETQRRLTAEMEGVFRWFQIEVLQAMEKNVQLDEEYIDGSRRVYELEVRNQAEALEKQLRRGAYRDSLLTANSSPTVTPENTEYMTYLRQSQQEILKEEERRYRFLAEKHCGLTQSLLFLINKRVSLRGLSDVPSSLLSDRSFSPAEGRQMEGEGQRDPGVQASDPYPRGPGGSGTRLHSTSDVSGPPAAAQGSKRSEVTMTPCKTPWPSLMPPPCLPPAAPSPLPSRSRSGSVGESPGPGGGRAMRALVSHPSSSNPKLLPFSRGEAVTVLVVEPRNGWLYGRTDSSLRQGWFPAAYVSPVEDSSSTFSTRWSTNSFMTSGTPFDPPSGGSLRSHSMNNLLDPSDTCTDQSEGRSFGDVPPPATPDRRASVDAQPSPRESGYARSPHGPPENLLFPTSASRGTNPFSTVKLRPTTTDDRSSPHLL